MRKKKVDLEEAETTVDDVSGIEVVCKHCNQGDGKCLDCGQAV